MEHFLPPFERAKHNIQEIASGLAISARLHNLVRQGEESRDGYLDRSLPKSVRIEALRTGREANSAIALYAEVQSLLGISA